MEERNKSMRKMLGGLVLLNLCAISLVFTAGEVSISNEEVLSQLRDLRGFIDEKRDFTKGAKGLKPVVVQYRSSDADVDGIVFCNLSFNTDALHLSIAGYSVQADGTPLSIIINVVYEWTEYVGYTIKSAKINASKSIALEDVSIDGDLDVDGDISGDSFDGDTQLEKIKDASGHNRFIEGDITTIDVEGVTYSYKKWSLSGTHLMVVLAGNILDETVFPSGEIANFTLPSWIMDKITAITGDRVIIAKLVAYGSDLSSQESACYLRKSTNMYITFGGLTLTATRSFRVEFDLLIDNASA